MVFVAELMLHYRLISMPMHMVQDRHPRNVLIGGQSIKSNGSSFSDFEDDVYNDGMN
jgi:hypothetical protein